nr:MAG TPA: hypothetical protein [Caudoviricetes sp.]
MQGTAGCEHIGRSFAAAQQQLTEPCLGNGDRHGAVKKEG